MQPAELSVHGMAWCAGSAAWPSWCGHRVVIGPGCSPCADLHRPGGHTWLIPSQINLGTGSGVCSVGHVVLDLV